MNVPLLRRWFSRPAPPSPRRRPESRRRLPCALALAAACAWLAAPVSPGAAAGDIEFYTPKILTMSGPEAPFLPDFSYAGYHWGEVPIPHHAPTVNVTDFGAIPDDGEDDTAAILAAVRAAHAQDGVAVVRFPPGRFRLGEVIWIERSHFVLQGSGSGEGGTTIELYRPLWDMDFSRVEGQIPWLQRWLDADRQTTGSPFMFHGGILWPRDPDRDGAHRVATVSDGVRGGHTLVADASMPIEVGRTYQLQQEDFERPGPLLDHVMDHVDITLGERTATRLPVSQIVSVVAVDGNRITLKEPLYHDVSAEWKNALETIDFLEEIGVEGFRFECPNRESYPGHGRERGYNPIDFTNVRNSWVRDLVIDNVDSGVIVHGNLVTVENVTVTGEIESHYGVKFGPGDRCLAYHVSADTMAAHTLSVNSLARGMVYSNCIVRRGRLDQHGGLNYQNLFDDVVVRDAQRGWELFAQGGNMDMMPLHGAFNTFWNIRLIFAPGSIDDVPHPLYGSINHGAAARLVGIRANTPVRLHFYNVDPWVEGVNEVLADEYASLYRWQLARRLGADSPRVARLNHNLTLPLFGSETEVPAGEPLPINAALYNWSFRPMDLHSPGRGAASLNWVITPLDAEARSHTARYTLPAALHPPEEERFTLRAGSGLSINGWLAPVTFPAPGLYEVVLVYGAPEGMDDDLRSSPRFLKVTG